MSKKTRKWTAGMSLAVSSVFLLMLGWARAEDNKKGTWKPFLSEEELKKVIHDEVSIMKQELSKKSGNEKVQQAALLIAVAAENWKDPKNSRHAAAVRDYALRLAKIAGKVQGRVLHLENMVNELERFQNIPVGGRTEKTIDWRKHFEEVSDAMLIFSREDPKGETTGKDFLALLSGKKTLDREQMTEKLQLMAYKSALIAEVTKDFSYKARDKNFEKWTEDMRAASLELAGAIKGKKEQNAKNAIPKLSKSCIGCHESVLGRGDVQELIAALQSIHTRQSAADALGDYGYAAENDKTVQPREPGSLEDFRLRLKPAILPLIEALKDKKENVRLSAKEALQKIGLKPEVPAPMVNEALHDSDEYVRFWFAYAFRDVGDKQDRVFPSLVDALKNPDKDIRGAAADILGRNAGQIPDARRALKDALNDKDPDVRGAAAKALRQIGKESDIPALIQALKDTDPVVRANAAIALARIGGAAIPELRKVLKDANRDARAAAAYALGRIGPKAKSAETELGEMLKEKDEFLRLAASAALAKISPTLPNPD